MAYGKEERAILEETSKNWYLITLVLSSLWPQDCTRHLLLVFQVHQKQITSKSTVIQRASSLVAVSCAFIANFLGFQFNFRSDIRLPSSLALWLIGDHILLCISCLA